MKFTKVLAGALAAAVVMAAAPLSVSVSADGYNAGDRFYAKFDPSTGEVTYISDSESDIMDHTGGPEDNGFYSCIVLDDGTISVGTVCAGHPYVHGTLGHRLSITIPSEINGYTVTEIRGSAGGYISITIPDTVKKLDRSSFNSDYFLEEIIFGENSQLEVIGDYAFQDCRSLKSVTIPATVKELGYGAFMNTIDEELVVPGGFDFTDVYSLTTVKVAKGSQLETIGDYAFQNQQALESVWILDGVTGIGEGAFYAHTDDLTIYGYTNSYDETYAKENEINFAALDGNAPAATDKPDVTVEPENDVITEAPAATTTTATPSGNNEDKNSPTGLVIAFIPAIAAAAGIIITKKRK